MLFRSATHAKLGETDPGLRMQTFFADYLAQLRGICEYATKPGVTDALVALHVQAVMDETRSLLMGIPPTAESEDD